MTKKLIVCSDGTWNSPNQAILSNAAKLGQALLKTDTNGIEQVSFYDPGIGANENFLKKYIGGATGWGISKNIRDCYQFLVNNYAPGDEIYCFGFSRGAYTVRSLIGFATSFGLLNEQDRELFNHNFDMIYDLYRIKPNKRSQHKNFEKVEQLKSRTVKPRCKFVGVWDTVGALGAPTPLMGWINRKLWVGFHDTELRNTNPDYRDSIDNSFSAPYWVFGHYLRPIGQLHEDVLENRRGVNEMLHASVVKRHAEDLPTFNPQNLAVGLQKLPVEPD